ncbi:MAG: AtpZ/AtpI family protein [Acidimicrobiales bacterium]
MTHEQPSQPNATYGDGLSIAFELVATPAVFGLVGVGLDRWLDTTPLFVLLLAGAAFATVVGLTIWRYGIEMEHHDRHRRSLRAERGPRPPRWERTLDPGDAEVSA